MSVTCASPAPPNTYGAMRVDVGTIHRTPPMVYHAGTRAVLVRARMRCSWTGAVGITLYDCAGRDRSVTEA